MRDMSVQDDEESDEDVDREVPKCYSLYSLLLCKYKFITVKSRAAVLTLIWNFLVFSCVSGVYGILLGGIANSIPFLRSNYAWRVTLVSLVKSAAMIFYPLTGWLADTYWGRYASIRWSMRLLWVGTLVLCVSLVVQSQYADNKLVARGILYGIHPVIFAIASVSLAGFQAIIIPFGTDQMPGASAEQYAAYLTWYIWTEYIGFGVVYTVLLYCASNMTEYLNTVYSIIMAACMTVAISLDFVFKDWLVIEPPCGNPITPIMKVLGYIRSTSRTQGHRSAFTYWEDKPPDRFDLAKHRYGGLFASDYVEDVRATLHILVVISSLAIPSITYGALTAIANPLLQQFEHASHHHNFTNVNTELTDCFSEAIVANMRVITAIALIPVFQYFLLPLLRNCWPSTLKRLAATAMLQFIAVISLLIIDSIGRSVTMRKSGRAVHNSSMVACFIASPDDAPTLGIPYAWLAVPNFFSGLTLIIAGIAGYEFICAQVPQRMKGFVIGYIYSVYGVFFSVGYILLLVFYLVYRNTSYPSQVGCGVWYFGFNLINLMVGFVLFCVVSIWYRPRQRNEADFGQFHAEVYYDGTASERAHN